MVSTTSKHPQNGTKAGLLTWRDILPWQKDNEFILTGYRRASSSYPLSLTSTFQVHNETANIWSHLIGCLQFLYGLSQFLSLPSASRTSDVLAVSAYYSCVVVCFLLSTIFHVFSDHSVEMHRFGNELDHLGIVLVMWGTGVSAVHFTFACDPALKHLHFLLLGVTVAGCGVFTLRPRFRQPTYRTVRFFMYCFLGASLFAPVIQGWIKYGWDGLNSRMDVGSFFGLGLINFSGAAVYAMRIPERWFPKRFDLLGQSHNWMHVLVLTGALVRLNGLLRVCENWTAISDRDGWCMTQKNRVIIDGQRGVYLIV